MGVDGLPGLPQFLLYHSHCNLAIKTGNLHAPITLLTNARLNQCLHQCMHQSALPATHAPISVCSNACPNHHSRPCMHDHMAQDWHTIMMNASIGLQLPLGTRGLGIVLLSCASCRSLAECLSHMWCEPDCTYKCACCVLHACYVVKQRVHQCMTDLITQLLHLVHCRGAENIWPDGQGLSQLDVGRTKGGHNLSQLTSSSNLIVCKLAPG